MLELARELGATSTGKQASLIAEQESWATTTRVSDRWRPTGWGPFVSFL